MQKNNEISAFPTSIGYDNVSENKRRLESAQDFYRVLTDAPRTCLEAMNEYTRREGFGEANACGPESIWATRSASVAHELGWTIIACDVDEAGHGRVLCHDDGGESNEFDDHRLLLIVWDHVDVNHFWCDVTTAVRIEPCAEYNDEVAARLVPNGDGTFSAPSGQVRYALAARDIHKGQRIVYGGVVCTVEHDDHSEKLRPYVEFELAGGVRFTVHRDLEITYVDKAG